MARDDRRPRDRAPVPAAPHGVVAADVQVEADHRCRVSGTFYRAVSSAHRSAALHGSRLAGRYSSPAQPTLYLSSSPEGVAAAMLAHGGARQDLEVLRFEVQARGVVDLRDPSALAAAGIDLDDALAPWQDVVASGGVPRSWGVRDRLQAAGAQGLIDPSRTQPGLWHLVLFAWNTAGAARVTPLLPPTGHPDDGAVTGSRPPA